MTEDTSDKDLREMEARLAHYRPGTPDAILRQRILQQTRSRSRWSFLEAATVIVLVGLNLVQTAGTAMRMPPPPQTTEARTQQIAQAITRLDLPLTQDDTYLMAQQLAAGEHLVPLPLIHGKTNDSNKGVLQ